MTITIIVNLIGLLLIALIVWWFWLRQSKSVKTNSNQITIYVKDGIYDPNRVEVPANENLMLKFIRQDPSPCSETVNFEDLNIHATLPLNQAYSIEVPALTPGEYRFACQMGMYQGKIIVKN